MAVKRTTTEKKTTARKPALRRRKQPVTHEQIAERAYFLHLERGGDAFENWLVAERELATA
jgi:hypothetical protein